MPDGRRWYPWLIFAAGCLIASTVLLHPWLHDDTNIVAHDDRLHAVHLLWRVFFQPYWPPPYHPDLYRPLSSILFGLEWVAGNGSPIPSRIVSIVLFGVLCVLVLKLTRRVTTRGAAMCAALYFLAQPVHSEAIAEVVNQSELLGGIWAILLVDRYLEVRSRGLPSFTDILGMLVIYTLACLTKESGVTFMGLLVAAELFLVQESTWARRIRATASVVTPQLVVAILFITVRTRILHSASGTFVAEAFEGVDMKHRALTMLAVVPHWAALLSWPTHLQIDYSPKEIVAATAWGSDQTIGALMLLLAFGAFVWSAMRQPRIAFGLLWIAIGLFPVSNILVATGIVLAERTMLLPSVGVVFLFLPAVEVILAWASAVRVRNLIIAGLGLALLVDGSSRLVSRLRTYRNIGVFWLQALADAPDGYRATMGLGQVLWHTGNRHTGEALLRRAIELDPTSLLPYLALGDLYRFAGECNGAAQVYETAVNLAPTASNIRASLIACLLYDGRYADASARASDGLKWPVDSLTFRSFLNTADSAARVNAPPHSVRLTVPDSLAKAELHP